ncbi:MAG: OsmC family protein [bacterium]|nr:OsmC family protein [bacterium]
MNQKTNNTKDNENMDNKNIIKSEIIYQEGLRFVAVSNSNHAIVLDSKKDVGGFESANSPMELLSIALIGCTAMDVISIIKKMRENVTDFRVFFEGIRAQEHPKVFTSIKLIYQFKGKDLKYENLEKAVKLSYEKYCSVSNMLKKAVDIQYEIKVIQD